MDEDKIKAVLNTITTSFSKLDMEAWFSCFQHPCMIVTPQGSHVLETIEQCEKLMGSVFNQLKEQNFVKSSLDDCKIKLLSDYAAVASAVWSRFDNNDELIQQFGASYIFSKTNGDWKISLLTSHSANTSIL